RHSRGRGSESLLGSSELEQYAILLIRLSRKVQKDNVGLIADFPCVGAPHKIRCAEQVAA
ncbi:MAG TPA: hypothetical protein VNB49_08945, partial [Candidatus Dormibacteraeota bacterium]|nr:hypothetical protein [Candidatus Dormibacteraeota bacterium]